MTKGTVGTRDTDGKETTDESGSRWFPSRPPNRDIGTGVLGLLLTYTLLSPGLHFPLSSPHPKERKNEKKPTKTNMFYTKEGVGVGRQKGRVTSFLPFSINLNMMT